tara:strand:- start:51 stop:374 length:324 start_codon:yes stop_codon:yes gene_type:complete
MTKVSASHILIMHNESRDSRSAITKDEALKKIIEIKDQYIKGKKDFKELAVNNSDCSSGKKSGGYLGEFGRGVMVKPFEEAVFGLDVGELSEPVETEFGYHIILRDK